MKRMLLGSFLAAIIIMVVGAIFWMVIPAGISIIKPVPHEDALLATLKEQLPEDGAYILPFPKADMKDPVFQQKRQQGPLVQIFFHRNGEEISMPAQMAIGFLHYWLSAFLLAGLLSMARIANYGSRLLFIILGGSFATVSVQLLNPIWWHHPIYFHLVTSLHQFVNWLLAGFIMAAIVRPRTS